MSFFRRAPALHLLYLSLWCAAAVCPVFAQSASVSGRVTDASSAVVNGAQITLTNPSRKTAQHATTNSSGFYTVPYVRPGTYTLTVDAAGFGRYERDSISIESTQSLALDVRLQTSNGATSSSSATPSVIQLAPVQVGGQIDDADKPYTTPGSSAYLSHEDIERKQQTTIGDLFKEIPGITSVDDNNGPNFDLNIRGLAVGRVPVKVDGASAAVTSYQGYSGAGTSNYVDPDLMGGITVLKGPSAGVEGANAIGGLVSMRTLDVDDILPEKETYGIRIRGGLGDNTRSPVVGQAAGVYAGGPGSLFSGNNSFGSITAAVRKPRYEALAAFVHRQAGNYFSGKNGPTTINVATGYPASSGYPTEDTVALSPWYNPGNEVLNEQQSMDSTLLKATLRFTPGSVLELANMYYINEYGQVIPSETSINLGPGQPAWNQQNAAIHSRQNNYTARYRWKPEHNDLIDFRANGGFVFLKSRTAQVSPADESVVPLGGIPFLPSDDHAWSGDVSNTSRFRPRWGDASLTYGGSIRYENLRSPAASVPFLPPNGAEHMTSLFVSGEWTPIDWLKLDAAVRYDGYRTKDKANPASLVNAGYGDNNPNYAGVELYGHGVSPIASVTVIPFHGVQVYAMYAGGFRAPNLFESSNDVGGHANAALKPEHARNWEYGLNLSRDHWFLEHDKVRVKIDYFNDRLLNPIVRDYWCPLPGCATIYYRWNNFTKDAFSGIEATLNYDTPHVFAQGSTNYYTGAEFCKNPYPVVPGMYYEVDPVTGAVPSGCQNDPYSTDFAALQVPPLVQVSATVGARLLKERLVSSARVTHVGPRTGGYQWDIGGTGEPYATYNLLDAFLDYKIVHTLSFGISGENLTNRYYYKPQSYALLPSAGRTVRFNLTLQFGK